MDDVFLDSVFYKKAFIDIIFSKASIDINEYDMVIWQYGQYQILFQISLPTTFPDRNQIANYSSLLKSKILTAYVKR